MKRFLLLNLCVLLCLGLCACSAPDISSGNGSKDRTNPESREDWNSSSQNELQDPQEEADTLPAPAEDGADTGDEQEKEPVGDTEPEDLLDLPPVGGNAEDIPAAPTVSDLSGTWLYGGEGASCTLTFSGTKDVAFLCGKETDPQTFEGTFQLDGSALSLSLTGPGGEFISPLFTVTVDGESMTLNALTGSTLPSLSKEGETLVFTLAAQEE